MDTLSQKIERAKGLIREYTLKYPKHSFSYSGGKDSEVLIHLAYKALGDRYPRTFAVLSNTEFSETFQHVEEHKRAMRGQMVILKYQNDGAGGADCCRSKKVEMFKRAVKGVDCWFSGIRKDEGITRAEFKHVEEKDGLVKVNPILDFTEADIWRYLAIYGVKVNPKYREGYRSLSCALCSVVEQSGDEPERAGRWKGTEHEGTECGIHTQSLRK